MLIITSPNPLAIKVCDEAGKRFYYFGNDSGNVKTHNGVRLMPSMSSDDFFTFINEHEIKCIIKDEQHYIQYTPYFYEATHLPIIHLNKDTGKHVLRRIIEKTIPEFFPLKTGLTTGACATAAAKAALLSLLFDEQPEDISFALPDGEILSIPVEIESKGIATVVKDFSDDPDVTKGCRITARLQHSDKKGQGVRFLRGKGVGIVTLPGLGIPIGEPAINQVPRQMITQEIRGITNDDVDVTISVENGEEIAKRTFNSKVGVVGGISIIGTSGIVSPLSNEAFIMSIGRELEVAKAVGYAEIGFASGKKGEMALRKENPKLRVIHYGNFIGEALKKAHTLGFKHVTIGIMIGKAVKLAEGHLDTHSHKVQLNKDFLKTIAGSDAPLIDSIVMARELWEIMPSEFFQKITHLCYQHCRIVFPDGELSIKVIPHKEC